MSDTLTFILYIPLLIVLFAGIVLMIFSLYSMHFSSKSGSPFVSNDNQVIKKALTTAKLKNKDTLVDIGSGDGRVLRIGIKDFNARKAIGYEISPLPYYVSKIKNKWFFIRNPNIDKNKIKIVKQDILTAKLEDATVIYIYLFPEFSKKITPYLVKLLTNNKNLRIVSVSFPLDESIIQPTKVTKEFHKLFRRDSEIFLYEPTQS